MKREREPATDELIHAYLDGEIEEADAERLVEALHGDREQARKLREFEALAERVAELPRPPLPEGFTVRALERALGGKPPRRSWRDRILGPRLELRLSWAGLGAVTAGLAILVAGAGVLGFTRGEHAAHELFAAAGAGAGAPAGVLPVAYGGERRGDPVRFVLRATDADRVELAGDFNDWVPTPLQRRPDGFFEAVVPLQPGRYEYAFIVDGAWGPDPAARRYVEDGFGGKNSVIEL